MFYQLVDLETASSSTYEYLNTKAKGFNLG